MLFPRCFVRIWLLAMILVTSGGVWSQEPEPEPKRYALLIAVTKYRHTALNTPRPLKYPEIDAKAVGTFLQRHGYEVDFLLGQQATQQHVKSKLAALANRGNHQGACVVGLWGHGVEFDGSDEAMFCPFDAKMRIAKDANGKELYDSREKLMNEPDPSSLVGMSSVLSGLRLCGAGNRLLIADCCRSSSNRPRGRAFGATVKLTDLPDNTAAIFACKADEEAFEHDDWGHGAFSSALLNQLSNMVAREEPSITSILGPLKNDVAKLVRDVSKGKDKQTIDPLVNGLPDLKLKSPLPRLVTNRLGMQLRLIPAGEFLMGSPLTERGRDDAEEQHRVRITKPYYLGVTEVTQGQWKSVMGTEPWSGKSYVRGGSDYPATYVPWTEAVEFCKKLSQREGEPYRLPTEAEWEYACRAGSKTAYSFGDAASSLKDYEWFRDNADHAGEDYAHRVAQKRANAFGLYDMHGNVWEWCADWYDKDYYGKSPLSDPTGPDSSSFRVVRGGCWYAPSHVCRSAFRARGLTDYRTSSLGFRVLRSSVQ